MNIQVVLSPGGYRRFTYPNLFRTKFQIPSLNLPTKYPFKLSYQILAKALRAKRQLLGAGFERSRPLNYGRYFSRYVNFRMVSFHFFKIQLMPFYTKKNTLKRQERMNKHIEEIKLKRKGQLRTIIVKDEPQKFDQIYEISQITINEQAIKKFAITKEIIQKSNEIPIHRHQLEERIKVDQVVLDKCIQLKNYNEHEFDNLYIDPTSLQLYQNNIQLERIQPCIVRDYTHFRVRSNDKSNPNTTISLKQLQLGNFN
ncbi:Hypothetical_protein [Hexamita inflata]|uniref:Hypothetical_protein n=1 Tax=Hexamita inflata TaxID=28002 RepID=A0AA86TRM0_9EUKA|nr:Hypothetical protein HINF_LOCUS14204 [Hexamita inflata]